MGTGPRQGTWDRRYNDSASLEMAPKIKENILLEKIHYHKCRMTKNLKLRMKIRSFT